MSVTQVISDQIETTKNPNVPIRFQPLRLPNISTNERGIINEMYKHRAHSTADHLTFVNRNRNASILSQRKDINVSNMTESFNHNQIWANEMNRSPTTATFVSAWCYCLIVSPGLKEVMAEIVAPLAVQMSNFVAEKNISAKAELLAKIQQSTIFQEITSSEFRPEEALVDLLDTLTSEDKKTSGRESALTAVLRISYDLETTKKCCNTAIGTEIITSHYLEIAGIREVQKQDRSFAELIPKQKTLKCASCQAVIVANRKLVHIGNVVIVALEHPSGLCADLHLGDNFGVYHFAAGIEFDAKRRFKLYFKKKVWTEVNHSGVFSLHSQPKAHFRFIVYVKEIAHPTHKEMKARELFEACLLCFLHSNHFRQACHLATLAKHHNFPSRIGAILTEHTDIDIVQKCIARVWEEFKLYFHNAQNPSDFLEAMLECTYRRKKVRDEFLAVELSTFKMCKCWGKYEMTEIVREPTLKLQKPTKFEGVNGATWYGQEEFYPDDQYEEFLKQDEHSKRALYLGKFRKSNKKNGHRKVTTQDCLEFRQRTKIATNQTGFGLRNEIVCQHIANLKKFDFRLTLVTRTSSLLIVQFVNEASCSLIATQVLCVNGKRYTLEGVIRGKEEAYTSYFKIAQGWVYFGKDGNLKRKRLNETEMLHDVCVMIYEDSNAKVNLQSWCVTPAPIDDLPEPYKPQVNQEPISLLRKKKKRRLRLFLETLTPVKSPAETTLNRRSATAIHSRNPSQDANARLGIPNLGMTCYMNAVLNCLFVNQRFEMWLRRFGEKDASRLTVLMNEFMSTYQKGHTIISIKELVSKILMEVRPDASISIGGCANEFFAVLCSKFRQLSPTDENINRLFSIYEKWTYTCQACNFAGSNVIMSYLLEVHLRTDNERIEDLLIRKYQPGECTRKCDSCEVVSKHTTQTFLQSTGCAIVIYINIQNPASSSKAVYPKMINFRPFLESEKNYHLSSITRLIFGESNHAVAETFLDGQRYLFNDESGDTLSPRQDAPGVPYLLFYERDELAAGHHPLGLKDRNGLSAVLNVLYFTPGFREYLKPPSLQPKGDLGTRIKEFVSQYEIHANLDETCSLIATLLGDKHTECAANVFQTVLERLDTDFRCNVRCFRNLEFEELRSRRVFGSTELHEMFSVLVESVWLCCDCKSMNELKKWQYVRTLEVTIPKQYEHFKWGNDEVTAFDDFEYFTLRSYSCYYPQRSITEYVINAAYVERMKRRHKVEQSTTNIGVDLDTCLRYYFRFHTLKNKDTFCLKCSQNSSHFRQMFLRYTGSALAIHLNKTEVSLNSEVRFPEELNLEQFFGFPAMYRLYALVARIEQSECFVTVVKMNMVWFQYDNTTITEVADLNSFYKSADMLFYHKV